jgi:hypothetical protein
MARRFGAPGWTLATTPTGVLAGVGIVVRMRQALQQAALELQSEWKGLLAQPGSGATYTNRFATIGGHVVPFADDARPPHTASAPGQPPAKDTGELAASIQIDDSDVDRIRVGTNLRYGLALEYGVNTVGSKVGAHPDPGFVILPRPHARPAKDRAEPKMKDRMIRGAR